MNQSMHQAKCRSIHIALTNELTPCASHTINSEKKVLSIWGFPVVYDKMAADERQQQTAVITIWTFTVLKQ